jgi:hypothetical protein
MMVSPPRGGNVVRLGGPIQCVAQVPFLAARGIHSRLALRFGLGTIQAIRGRWLAGVATVLCQSPFQFDHSGRQRFHLLRQRLNLRKQRPDQFILLGVAQSVKIRQFLHALSIRLVPPS